MIPPHTVKVVKLNVDEWVRQQTPPDSPPPSYSQAMRLKNTDGSFTSKKMSLDFIAPGSCSALQTNLRRSSPVIDGVNKPSLTRRGQHMITLQSPVSMSSPPRNYSNHIRKRCSTRLPSPTWSSSSAPALSTQPEITPLRNLLAHRPAPRALNHLTKTKGPHVHRIQKPQSSPPPPYSSTQTPQRAERPGYCPEGRYAIIYLRGVLNYKWSDVLDRFTLLFPPGQVARCQITGLPNTYPKRDVQGLQCRWYRIREEEGLVPLRDTQYGDVEMTTERKVLERMLQEEKVSLQLVGLVEDVGELGV